MNKMLRLILSIPLCIAVMSTTGCNKTKTGGDDSKPANTDANGKSDNLNPAVHIDQLGYRPGDRKLVIVAGKSSDFEVINESTGNSVLKGKLSGAVADASTNDTVVYGDFTEIKTPGKYFVKVPGLGKSYSFQIDEKVYDSAKNGLLKALYFQRCGTELDKAYADKWHHGICHTAEATLYENPATKLDVSGGWHDAGDYGRYVVPAAKAVADLLISYEFFPKAFEEDINIPESSNNIPDILNEAKYEIDWLFKMQDKTTGGVYSKVATPQFPGMIMPEKDKAPLVIYHISSPATADFAATMALSARIYKDVDKAYSDKCMDASVKAWKWLVNNPEPKLFKNPKDAGSGEYGDGSDLDERFWAAVELYKATGDEEYHKFFKEALAKLNNTISLGWADMGGYGAIAYLSMDNSKIDSAAFEKLKNRFLSRADQLVKVSELDGYKVTLKPTEYNWGSNMEVLNNAMHLIIANKLKSNKAYIDAALDQWHYVFGANSLNISYVTGFGSKVVMNPHHRPSEDDGVVEPVPGMVSGGPNKGLQDDAAKRDCVGQPPAKCFTDHMGSYSTNEITIYWNSPAVFVGGYLNNK